MEQAERDAHWREGQKIPGVTYKRDDIVRLLEGPFTDELATVTALLGVTPEPCYRVVVEASGVELDVAESSLGPA